LVSRRRDQVLIADLTDEPHAAGLQEIHHGCDGGGERRGAFADAGASDGLGVGTRWRRTRRRFVAEEANVMAIGESLSARSEGSWRLWRNHEIA
jgi:hypothetical protein